MSFGKKRVAAFAVASGSLSMLMGGPVAMAATPSPSAPSTACPSALAYPGTSAYDALSAACKAGQLPALNEALASKKASSAQMVKPSTPASAEPKKDVTPSAKPSAPVVTPSVKPSAPVVTPSVKPSVTPSAPAPKPSTPVAKPSSTPSVKPPTPVAKPSSTPSVKPSTPVAEPSAPAAKPSNPVAVKPSAAPTMKGTAAAKPSVAPSVAPGKTAAQSAADAAKLAAEKAKAEAAAKAKAAELAKKKDASDAAAKEAYQAADKAKKPAVSAVVKDTGFAGTTGDVALTSRGGSQYLAYSMFGYPYANSPKCTAGESCVPDKWAFYQGQCVSWVSFRLNDASGVGFDNSYKGQHWGSARNWGYAANAAGIPVNTTPARGAVAWYANGRYGHVAYVERVNADGSVLISEMNHNQPNGFQLTTISKNHRWPTGFIHIKDLENVQGGLARMNLNGADAKKVATDAGVNVAEAALPVVPVTSYTNTVEGAGIVNAPKTTVVTSRVLVSNETGLPILSKDGKQVQVIGTQAVTPLSLTSQFAGVSIQDYLTGKVELSSVMKEFTLPR